MSIPTLAIALVIVAALSPSLNNVVLSTRVGFHLGRYKRLMTDADQERKFRPMAKKYSKLPKNQVNRLLDRLGNLEQVET